MTAEDLIRTLNKLAYMNRRNAGLAKKYEVKLRCEARAEAYKTAADWVVMFCDGNKPESVQGTSRKVGKRRPDPTRSEIEVAKKEIRKSWAK